MDKEPLNMDDNVVDRLARAIHERYRASFEPGQDAPTTSQLPHVAFDDLAPEDKVSNRLQAEDIRRKLRVCGLRPCETGSGGRALTLGDLDPFIEKLAEAEHDRWWQAKIDDGWRFGAVRDDDAKVHPLMIPYEGLSEAEKELDREPIRALPEYLRLAGLEVVPIPDD